MGKHSLELHLNVACRNKDIYWYHFPYLVLRFGAEYARFRRESNDRRVSLQLWVDSNRVNRVVSIRCRSVHRLQSSLIVELRWAICRGPRRLRGRSLVVCGGSGCFLFALTSSISLGLWSQSGDQYNILVYIEQSRRCGGLRWIHCRSNGLSSRFKRLACLQIDDQNQLQRLLECKLQHRPE